MMGRYDTSIFGTPCGCNRQNISGDAAADGDEHDAVARTHTSRSVDYDDISATTRHASVPRFMFCVVSFFGSANRRVTTNHRL